MLETLLSLIKPRLAVGRSPQRVLIVGSGKSGTTALHFRIKHAMRSDTVGVFEPQSMDAIRQKAGERAPVVAKMLLPAVDSELDDLRHWFGHRVLIVRDPRDVIVSSLLYTTAYHFRWNEPDTRIADYVAVLREKEAAPASVSVLALFRLLWRDFDPQTFAKRIRHLDGALRALVENDRPFYVVTYEDMVSGRLHHLGRYLGLDLSTDNAVEPGYERVARTRRSGNWRHWFTDEDVMFFRPLFAPIMEYFGYDTADWRLAYPPVIEARHGSAYFARVVDERRRTSDWSPD